MHLSKRLLAGSILLLPMLALAQPADAPLRFAEGPAQWLMTAEEKRAWKGVKTEDEARELIDLFWVRRDPSPGTFVNEFRTEFDQRVEFADRRFKEDRRRGSLTERGRVLVMLGFPRELGEEAQKTTTQMGVAGAAGALDPTGGRAVAARDVWNYAYEESIRFGMPKIEVIFIHDGMAGRVRRDTQRNDFMSAMPAAVKYYIRNPDLTVVPEWARRSTQSALPVAPMPATAPRPVEPPLPDAPVPVLVPGAAPPEAPAAAVRPLSVGKLTLVKDAFAIEPESGEDPFARLVAAGEFGRDGELGWLLEYCTGTVAQSLETVEVALKISGLINGERVNFNAPAEEMAPDSIKASPGCYLVRGTVPLMDMDPGTYTLMVTMGRYNLTREFRVIGQ